MQENKRVPIYKAFRDVLDRHLTPAERIELDRFIDRSFHSIPRGMR